MNEIYRTNIRCISATRTLAIAAVIAAASFLLDEASVIVGLPCIAGIDRAWGENQQKESEDSAATAGPVRKAGAQEGTESFSELIEERKVSREFLRDIETRLQAVREREAVVERREKALERVQRDIEEKLALLEKKREDLQALTRQIDTAREKDLKQAVNMYRAMEAESAAKVFLEMDLEFVVAVLKRLDVETAGGIYDAMVEQAATGGTDPEKTRKIKQIGEFLVNPTRFREINEGQATPTLTPTATP